MSFVKVMSWAFVLLCLFHFGLALNCFNCTSESNANCKDPKQLKATGCNFAVPAACQKSTALNKVTNQMEIFRKCTFQKTDNNDPCEVLKNKLMTTNKYTDYQCLLCDKDECNGASYLKINLFLTTLIFLFTFQRIYN